MVYVIGGWIVVAVIGTWWTKCISDHPGPSTTRAQYYYRKGRRR